MNEQKLIQRINTIMSLLQTAAQEINGVYQDFKEDELDQPPIAPMAQFAQMPDSSQTAVQTPMSQKKGWFQKGKQQLSCKNVTCKHNKAKICAYPGKLEQCVARIE